jgi:protocatechuate 3,4-dioxygenase beta subunit
MKHRYYPPKYLLIIYLWLGLYSNLGLALVSPFNPLKQTPSALIPDNLSKPREFGKGNNLVRKPGSFKLAIGEPLYIAGTVTDAFGVPIDGVLVKIWQTNAAGAYHSLLSKNSKYLDNNFLMSGQSITDNMGRYRFLTIFPGFYDDRAPHINFIISHKRFGIIETEMYFTGHPKNSKDPIYMTYPKEDRKLLTATVEFVSKEGPENGRTVTFNIVMDGLQQYKRY